MDARAIAFALGGDVLGGDTVSAPGPGHSPRDRSLSIRISVTAPDGFVVYSHAGEDPIACRDHVRQRLGLPPWQPGDGRNRRVPISRIKAFHRDAVERNLGPRPRSEDDLIRIKRANAIWAEGTNPRGTIAEKYLNSRRLFLTDQLAGIVLRYHPRCPWRNENTGETERLPALIAAFRSVDDDEITAIHRIALNPDGTKRERRMLGIVHRAAVKLEPASSTLCIGEGVETCLAALELGYKPVWALGSVGTISFFPVLDGVRTLKILAETGQPSEEAIKMCGRRWHRAGHRVRVIQSTTGSDLNDELMATINGQGN